MLGTFAIEISDQLSRSKEDTTATAWAILIEATIVHIITRAGYDQFGMRKKVHAQLAKAVQKKCNHMMTKAVVTKAREVMKFEG